MFDQTTKTIIWIALGVVLVTVVIFGTLRIIEVMSSAKNNEVTAE